MAKRRHGEGTISKLKDGRYQVRIHAGYRPDGREIRPTRHAKTQKEAVKVLQTMQQEYESGLDFENGKTTLEEWAPQWCETKINHVKPRTLQLYLDVLKKYIFPIIGKRPVNAVKPIDISRVLNSVMGERDEDGRIAKHRTAEIVRIVLNGVMSYAEDNDLIIKNPVSRVKLPPRHVPEIEPMTNDEVDRLLVEADKDRCGIAYYIFLKLGLRRGEVAGLRWQDIDFEKGTIWIRKQLARAPQGYALDTPKTMKSVRRLSLGSDLNSMLCEHKLKQNAERELLGVDYSDHDFVIAREDGNPYYPDFLYRRFQLLLERAGIKHYRLHDTRHTFASRMMELGAQQIVTQEILGHTTSIMTNHYTHVTNGLQERELEKMDKAVAHKVRSPLALYVA